MILSKKQYLNKKNDGSKGYKKSRQSAGFVLVGIAICGGAIAFNECDASLVQIVWGHFNADAFANVYPDACFAHFATDSC